MHEQVGMEDLEIEHADMAYWRTEDVLKEEGVGESASEIEVLKLPYDLAMENDWEGMKRYYADNPRKLNSPMTVDEDTALHIVASCCTSKSQGKQVLEFLINLLPQSYDERCKAVRVPNKLGNNVLHEVAMSGSLEAATFLVSNFNKPPGKTSNEENSTLPLLDIRNELGESPLYRAAALGHPDLVQFFAEKLEENPENLLRHFHRNDRMSILHIAVIGQQFRTALWLQRKYPFLATKREGLPARDLEVTTNPKDDVESSLGSNQDPQAISWKKPEEMDIIEKIWKDKRIKHALKNLIPLLVEKDNSWQNSKEAKGKTISLGSVENLCKGDNDGGDQQGKDSAEPTNSKKQSIYKYNPLLIATITGIVPIVAEILRQHPQAAEHVSHSEQNILHLAIKHRQREILELLKRKPITISRLNEMIDSDGNTILHQAADRSYYSVAISEKLIGPAMQLQAELRWMMGVKNILPPHYIMHHNNKDQTAEELFNDEHNELLKSAQEWIKDTAQSCSTVAVLVATVVFAAAYAMPGGNEPNGLPVFHDSPLFWLFTCMDVVAIACSLSSVAFFLSILSSPLEYPFFCHGLPRKLMIGFTLLFLSMATTMLAFAATILLVIRIEKKWTKSLLYCIAFFPVPLFGLLQFPMYQKVTKIFLPFFIPFLGFSKRRSICGKSKAN
ncbi:Ankyrin repeat family protein [Prunus dulcis]|uniref:Ankyrin repeat family protein n=1 Tax=Prunus dulcis TaxID=3755 RepID=A0A4Y1R975_PRUDU|nr:Ankyrin repeat family protein [Prunus dulcis]